MSLSYYAVNEPVLDGDEEKYVLECIRTGWISSEGPFVKKFEESFALSVDRKFAISVANGSVALDVAFFALDLPKGSKVILPSFTIMSCAAAVVRAGLKPVFVDCDPLTFNMKAQDVIEAYTPDTSAVMIVHLYGLPVDLAKIIEFCSQKGLKVIEDSAQAIGQQYRGQKCGSFGDISCFSFYPNKHITTGEGGMVVTNDLVLDQRSRSFKNLCFVPERRFLHYELGQNFRLTNLQCAIGLAQLQKLEKHLIKKREIGLAYLTELSDLDEFDLPVAETEYAKNLFWVNTLTLKKGSRFKNAHEFALALHQEGIGTRPYFYPLHLQPVFKKMGLVGGSDHAQQKLPECERIFDQGLYLPSGLNLDAQKVKDICQRLKKVIKK